tara:strand:+ start:818 stop:1177 length:360 start_codon:yes stop_codon:yes gene_type:complete
MGQTWFMYARDTQDYWIKEPLYSTLISPDDIDYHMGRFKHKVFMLGLGELKVHKLYLYQGWTREVKCWFQEDTLKVEFSTERARASWKTSKRSHKGRKFDSIFTKVDTKEEWVINFTKS